MRIDNRERSEYYREYYQRNKEKKKAYQRNRPTEIKYAIEKKHLKKPGVMAYKKATRRANIKLAVPSWYPFDQKKVAEIYAECQKLDGDMTVDHIIPIKSPLVCGLHVSWNMQFLSRSANSKKGNSLPPPHQYIGGGKNEQI